ncbi:MAG: hypothetical protein ACOCTG_06370, partial [Bacteroidota bacterium]
MHRMPFSPSVEAGAGSDIPPVDAERAAGLARLLRLAIQATSCHGAALVMRVGDSLRVVAHEKAESFDEAQLVLVGREVIESARFRYVCEEVPDGAVRFIAAEPIIDRSGSVEAALCVTDVRSRSASAELRSALRDLASMGVAAVREARGLIDSSSSVERLFSFVISTMDGVGMGLITPREVMKRVL